MDRHPAFECTSRIIPFFSSLLYEGYDLRLRVTGNSMAPFLRTGSVVTISRVPVEALRLGDIIFFRSMEDTLILHRLIGIKKDALVTKGDALASTDAPVPKTRYLGKVIRFEAPDKKPADIRDLESLPARVMSFLIVLYHRLRLNRIRSYIGIKRHSAMPL